MSCTAAPCRANTSCFSSSVNPAVSEPGEIMPDLQIEKFLSRKLARQPLKILTRDIKASFDQQFMVARIGADHRRPIGREKMPDQERLFFGREIGRGSLGALQKQIPDLASA